MTLERPDTSQKATLVNLDEKWYGTVAEIGAGQETARLLFQVGGAAGTVAKTMSAYDMSFSDAIYGKNTRYVSRERLQQMLDHESGLLGVSETSSDLRDLLDRQGTDPRAAEAVALFLVERIGNLLHRFDSTLLRVTNCDFTHYVSL